MSRSPAIRSNCQKPMRTASQRPRASASRPCQHTRNFWACPMGRSRICRSVVSSAPVDMTKIEIIEVGPRDGLQNQDAVLDTPDKLALIEKLIAAGARRIEAASFV